MPCESLQVTDVERGYLLFLCSHAEAAHKHIQRRKAIGFSPDLHYPCAFSPEDRSMVESLCHRGLLGMLGDGRIVPTPDTFELLERKWPGVWEEHKPRGYTTGPRTVCDCPGKSEGASMCSVCEAGLREFWVRWKAAHPCPEAKDA
jgi:hypothetical protein